MRREGIQLHHKEKEGAILNSCFYIIMLGRTFGFRVQHERNNYYWFSFVTIFQYEDRENKHEI